MSEPLLTKEEVSEFHQRQIHLFGGDAGVGDHALLESALAQPEHTYCYNSQADLFGLAAAYAFHIAKNHAFNDGNKRTALHAALAFLEINGTGIAATDDDLYASMIRLTTSEWTKDGFAYFLRRCHRI